MKKYEIELEYKNNLGKINFIRNSGKTKETEESMEVKLNGVRQIRTIISDSKDINSFESYTSQGLEFKPSKILKIKEIK